MRRESERTMETEAMSNGLVMRLRGAAREVYGAPGFAGLLACSLVLGLALGLALDVYVISCLIFAAERWAAVLAAVVFAVMAFLWFAFPRMGALHRVLLAR